MLQNEIAVTLLKLFIGMAVICTVLGFILILFKNNKTVSTIGKVFLILSCVSMISLVVLVFVQSSPSKTDETVITETVGTASFDEIYYAYEENELRADDVYKNNRYKITATINGISTGGLVNLTGGLRCILPSPLYKRRKNTKPWSPTWRS